METLTPDTMNVTDLTTSTPTEGRLIPFNQGESPLPFETEEDTRWWRLSSGTIARDEVESGDIVGKVFLVLVTGRGENLPSHIAGEFVVTDAFIKDLPPATDEAADLYSRLESLSATHRYGETTDEWRPIHLVHSGVTLYPNPVSYQRYCELTGRPVDRPRAFSSYKINAEALRELRADGFGL